MPLLALHAPQVLNSAEAAGAAPSTGAPAGGDATAASPAAFLPARELLFREFAEAVVRLAARRYPQLPSLERRLHQVRGLLGARACVGCQAAEAVALFC